MNATTRRIFPYLMLLLILTALGWAVSFGTLPKADFTFNNGTEIQTVDPAKATGSPEGRIINALFESIFDCCNYCHGVRRHCRIGNSICNRSYTRPMMARQLVHPHRPCRQYRR